MNKEVTLKQLLMILLPALAGVFFWTYTEVNKMRIEIDMLKDSQKQQTEVNAGLIESINKLNLTLVRFETKFEEQEKRKDGRD